MFKFVRIACTNLANGVFHKSSRSEHEFKFVLNHVNEQSFLGVLGSLRVHRDLKQQQENQPNKLFNPILNILN